MIAWLIQQLTNHRQGLSWTLGAVALAVLGIITWEIVVKGSKPDSSSAERRGTDSSRSDMSIVLSGLVAREIGSGTSRAIIRAETAAIEQRSGDFRLQDIEMRVEQLKDVIASGALAESTASAYLSAGKGYFDNTGKKLVLSEDVYGRRSDGHTIDAKVMEYEIGSDLIRFLDAEYKGPGIHLEDDIIETDRNMKRVRFK